MAKDNNISFHCIKVYIEVNKISYIQDQKNALERFKVDRVYKRFGDRHFTCLLFVVKNMMLNKIVNDVPTQFTVLASDGQMLLKAL